MEKVGDNEVLKTKLVVSMEKLQEAAVKMTYVDLLLGDYNEKYVHKMPAPHLMDMLLMHEPQMYVTSFTSAGSGGYGTSARAHDRAAYDESLYNECLTRKHYFVQHYRNIKSSKPLVNDTKRIVRKQFNQLLLQSTVLLLPFFGFAFYKLKLHKNKLNTSILLPIMAFCFLRVYARYQFTGETFDALPSPLPDVQAEREREAIVNRCMGRDFTLTMEGLQQEVAMCKPPGDYIYSTLI